MADTIYNLKDDLRMSMIIAAFTGISWFIGAEINTSLFLLFKRRRGLYFWSAALCSWGVVLQPLFIILADFGIWTDFRGSITMIYLTWLIMVVPQSWLLYSRLHLIANHGTLLRWIKIVLIFTSIVFSVPTIIMGTIAQATEISPGLFAINLIWDRVQLTVFFVQETALSLLYIWQARKYLRNSALLSQPYRESPSAGSPTLPLRAASEDTKRVLLHLVFANTMVIALDIALLGVQYADLFYLQGAFKPCVYGVKLKVEFAILNRLVEIVRTRGRGGAASSYPDFGDSRGGVVSSRVTGGGGGPHPRLAGQSQPQIHVSRIIETKWEDQDGNVDDGIPHEQIGLGNLEQPPARGSPRSQSHESQHRIWGGQGAVPADARTEVERPAMGQQAQQWRQVYHR
ncbi:hypothetical protein C8A01DRAFT_49749 [Parachaetomium inaequale]|uniref:DUF7703 domain-containing protein n=1 Tax=Parachaetomium inaequale TaxID=2588326 RepID=A0AAN6SN30_9PEZI|nr:hypothetical protein C8A01DRAFT_49749 [Parachaetomium inaequale]